MTNELTMIHAGAHDDVPQTGFRADKVAATIEAGRVLIGPQDVDATLGWKLRDEGLCRGDVCIPVRDRAALVQEDGIDLVGLAELLDRPLALDLEHGAAALGTSAGRRARRMESLQAPDFELPDLSGRLHRLSDYSGKKVLLIAHASW